MGVVRAGSSTGVGVGWGASHAGGEAWGGRNGEPPTKCGMGACVFQPVRGGVARSVCGVKPYQPGEAK